MGLEPGLLATLLVFFVTSASSVTDNHATRFVVAFPTNVAASLGDDNYVIVTAPIDTRVIISVPVIPRTRRRRLVAGQVWELSLPALNCTLPNTTHVGTYGVEINSTAPVSVYTVSARQNSTDSVLALPAVGSGPRSYVVTSLPPVSQGGADVGFMAVVAGEDWSGVAIRLQYTTPASPQVLDLLGVPYPSGSWINITLDSLEVFQAALPGADFTGTEVFSTTPVTVYGGAQCANVNTTIGDCSHLVSQIPPVSTWGRHFIMPSFVTRRAGDLLSLMSLTGGTLIDLSGVSVNHTSALNISLHHVPSSSVTYVRASDPIFINYFSLGANADGSSNAGAFVTPVVPVEQWTSAYSFGLPSSSNLRKFAYYGHVIVQTEFADGVYWDKHLILNIARGSATSTSAIIRSPVTAPFGNFTIYDIKLGTGRHMIFHTDPRAKLWITLYGYGPNEGHGHPAGTLLENLTVPFNCTPSNTIWGDNVDNDCDSLVDEEIPDGKDNDGDSLIDEDVAHYPPWFFLPCHATPSNCSIPPTPPLPQWLRSGAPDRSGGLHTSLPLACMTWALLCIGH